jgi:hypothetical protein
MMAAGVRHVGEVVELSAGKKTTIVEAIATSMVVGGEADTKSFVDLPITVFTHDRICYNR